MALHFYWRSRLARERTNARRAQDELESLQNERALKARTEQETLLNSLVEGLLVLDPDDRIRLANRAFLELFGLSSAARGKTLMEVLRSHELAGLVESVKQNAQVLGYELHLPGPAEKCLQINAAAVGVPEAANPGCVLVFHDVTRVKKLERTREEFVANVSHELRTPLSLIKGYTETLLGGAKDDPENATRFLTTIERNTERLNALIEDLLNISELETGRAKLDLQPVSFAAAGNKILSEFQVQANGKQMQLVNAAPDLTLQADSRRLEQVLTNLLDNAVKYGRCKGNVRLEARSIEGGFAEICVRDDGPGIPADSLDRLFERFYRVDKARSREQGGTGLGLSIVKHIVQSHGGRTWVQSQPGHGAAFYFTMPLAQENADGSRT